MNYEFFDKLRNTKPAEFVRLLDVFAILFCKHSPRLVDKEHAIDAFFDFCGTADLVDPTGYLKRLAVPVLNNAQRIYADDENRLTGHNASSRNSKRRARILKSTRAAREYFARLALAEAKYELMKFNDDRIVDDED